MNQDFEPYQSLIEQLKPLVNQPEFAQVFEKIAKAVPKQDRFLLKMELKRLAKPCIRRIDLRDTLKTECQLYEYEGLSHYLDDTAIQLFERQVRSFGEYTVGVYETIIDSSKETRRISNDSNRAFSERSEQSLTHPYHTHLLRFGRSFQRLEERMNYSVSVEIIDEAVQPISANTLDISVHGLRIKVSNKFSFEQDQWLMIRLKGLEEEFSMDKDQNVLYRVIWIQSMQDDQRIGLLRDKEETLDGFISKLVQGNKRRYKVNLDNTLEAIRYKTLEQYYSPNVTSLPVFIEEKQGLLVPNYALANDSNRETIYYWNDETNVLRLGYILSSERLTQLAEQPAEQRETYIYCFHHINQGHVYFYSATPEELDENPELKSVFLGFAARKASWKILKVQLVNVFSEQGYLPTSLPNYLNDSIRRQNLPLAARLVNKLKNTVYMALLTDLTEEVSTSTYQKIAFDKDQLPELKAFAHPRNKAPAPIEVFRFKFVNQRKETRYQLRTEVAIESESGKYQGISEDISLKGLKIELAAPYKGEKHSLVKMAFPDLQSKTSYHDLSALPYRVRHVSRDRTVLHLEAIHDQANEAAQAFFSELLENNKSQLKILLDEETIPGMGEVLRNICAANIPNVALFIHKGEAQTFLPEAAVTASNNARLISLLSFQAEERAFNFRFLFEPDQDQRNLIEHTLNQMKTNQILHMHELLIAFRPERTDYHKAVEVRLTQSLQTESLRRQFIKEATKDGGQFIALKVFLGRTGRPDLERMRWEMKYVSSYAPYRAQGIEGKLWSINGVGDIVDVTDEVLYRYGI
jgi:hypothetical protein